jgi:nucleotide-binding universal stress UspA family protein
MPEFRRILCPVDFSETSKRAFEYALALAARLGAEVDVIHVYHLSADAVALAEGTWEFPRELEADLTTRLQQQLDELVRHKPQMGVKVTTSLYQGIPYIEITRAAKERGADMIVIGTHGRTGLAHLLMGSVAERVVRLADVPVVSIRTR